MTTPREALKLLDLFSGIGGFSLGLERTGGFETVAFCEIDPFCQKVLRKHWPHVRQYQDVTKLTADQLRADGITVDAICGGFPCQDISVAGSNAGMGEGTRSGLWSEYARLIGELRPRYVIVENVSALLSRGLDRVLGDLAALGYDSEWDCIPASAVGAPHRRDRVWIIANAMCDGYSEQDAAHQTAHNQKRNAETLERKGSAVTISSITSGSVFSNPDSVRELQPQGREQNQRGRVGNIRQTGSDTMLTGLERQRKITSRIGAKLYDIINDCQWSAEPAVGRMAHGVPNRVDRLRALGNAVVPQIPELIGRAILEAYRTGAHK